jgi:hypothetical protein
LKARPLLRIRYGGELGEVGLESSVMSAAMIGKPGLASEAALRRGRFSFQHSAFSAFEFSVNSED